MTIRLLALALACLSFVGCADEPSTPEHDDTSSPGSEPTPAGETTTDAGGKKADAGASKPSVPAVKDAAVGGQVADAGTGRDAGTPAGDASAAPGAGAGADAAVAGGTCDHACLIGYLEGYLVALVAHDPSMGRFASTLRYTDNGKEAKLGDGLWKSASSLRADTRLLFADALTGQAALMLVVLEGSTPVIYQARIKVESGAISELETMTVRRQGAANGFFSPDGMVPKPVFLQAVSPDKRMTRDELKVEVDLYLDFLDGESGDKVHFDPMCVRFENGQQTAQAGRVGSQSWNFDVTRRYLVFDEEQAIVWGMFPFTQADTTLVVGEAFKVMDKKLMMIQAVMANIPAKTWK